jgi:peptidoglycan/LPS O-acetylase OafA/YrhL
MTAKVPGHKTDAEAFDGLRGTLAVWVAVGHFCLYSAWRNNLNNTFAMPFFFALSGSAAITFVFVQPP